MIPKATLHVFFGLALLNEGCVCIEAPYSPTSCPPPSPQVVRPCGEMPPPSIPLERVPPPVVEAVPPEALNPPPPQSPAPEVVEPGLNVPKLSAPAVRPTARWRPVRTPR